MATRDGLNMKQLKCIALMVYEGLSPTEVSRLINVNFKTVYNWFDNAMFLQEYNKELDKMQASLTSKAMLKLAKLADSNRESISLKATESILDRNGRAPIKKQEISTPDIDIKISPKSEE